MRQLVLRWRVSGRLPDGSVVVLAHSTDIERAERTAAALAGVDMTAAQRDARVIHGDAIVVRWEEIPAQKHAPRVTPATP